MQVQVAELVGKNAHGFHAASPASLIILSYPGRISSSMIRVAFEVVVTVRREENLNIPRRAKSRSGLAEGSEWEKGSRVVVGGPVGERARLSCVVRLHLVRRFVTRP